MKKYISILIVLCSLTWIIVFAHPGRTDSNGGHWVRKEGWGYEVGTYHYHNDGYAEETYTPSVITPQPPTSESPPVTSEAETKGYDADAAIWIMIAFFGGIPLLGLISGITSSIIDKIKNKQK